LRRFELHKALIVTGIAIVMTGLVLHWLTPENYGLYYGGLGLWSRTLMPALTYGMTFILVGITYSRAGLRSAIVSISILLLLSNFGFIFVVHDFLTTVYGPEPAFEIYFVISQSLIYPWIIANIAGIFYFLHMLKHKDDSDREIVS